MTTEKVAQVDIAQFGVVLLNELKLVLQYFAPVLQGHFRKVVQNRDHITRLHVVLDPQVVEEANKSLWLAPKESSTVLALCRRKIKVSLKF